MFEENPCRWNVFEAFQLDRSTTDLRAIRERVSDTFDVWKYHHEQIKLRNGELRAIDEARLNELKKRLENPLQRLKEEQLAHQVHTFAGDEELLSAVRGLAEPDAPGSVPTVAGAALLKSIGPLLPVVSAAKLEDDLPWPEPPSPFALERESLKDAILRDC